MKRPGGVALRLFFVAGLAATLLPLGGNRAAGAAAAVSVTTDRIGGQDAYEVAAGVSRRLFPSGGNPPVYLASGESWTGGLTAGAAAARDGGVVLLTRKDVLPGVTEREIARLAPSKLVITGGTASISSAVEASVREIVGSSAVTRVSGSDAYSTAAALSAGLFAPGSADTVIVATGADYHDALAAAPAAGAVSPLLLVGAVTLPAATSAEIKRIGPKHVVIVGSTTAISAAVATAIGKLGPAVERVGGADASATAASVASRFFPAAAGFTTADQATFMDSLAGGPLAARLGSPLVYMDPDEVPVPTRDAIRLAHPTAFTVLGGTDSVSDIGVGEMTGWSDGRLTILPPTPAYPAFDSGYHDYNEMLTMIRATEIAFPDLVHVFSIGKSYEGRDIWAAKISKDVSVESGVPEVLVDTLHHAGEHLGVEQALYLLKVLATDYGSDPYVHRLVDTRAIYIVFALNPDGWAYDLSGGAYHAWRKNRQPNTPSAYVGTDLNRNYPYKWACCGGSSSGTKSGTYHGAGPLSAPESKALVDFVLSRVVNGVQLIKTHVTLHTNGLLILWPFGWTYADVPTGMTADDHATFVAMGQAMAARNGYTPEQSSDLYITDGDEIDWMYGNQHIFSFTWELYPPEQYITMKNLYPPDEIIAPETTRNRSALLYLIDMAGCPYAAIGKADQYCGGAQPTPTPGSITNL